MFDLNNPDNFDTFSYHFPKTDYDSFPFLLHAARLGCTYEEAYFHIERENTYPFFTVHFLYDGCGLFHIAGKEYLLKKGDAFIITAGEAHSYSNHSDEPSGLIWIELSTAGCQEMLSYFKLHGIYTLDASHTQKPLMRLWSIISYIKDTGTGNEFELSALYYAFLMDLLEAASRMPSRYLPESVTEALAYMEEHFTEDIRISKLAEHLHISHAYLTRTFRKYMGTSPMKYLNLKRMEYACSMLKNTSLSCGKIAESIGMYDASHFNRFFSQQIGMTPSAYRQYCGKNGGILKGQSQKQEVPNVERILRNSN